jgi:hypothetical protein
VRARTSPSPLVFLPISTHSTTTPGIPRPSPDLKSHSFERPLPVPTYYRGCWHVVSRTLFTGYRPLSSPVKGLYNPKAFIAHAALLHQAFAHCAIFLTAASRRSLARVAVPVWGITLSRPLPVIGLVGRYPTNYLMGRRPIPKRLSTLLDRTNDQAHEVLATVSSSCSSLWGRSPTCYSPVCHSRFRRIQSYRTTCMC